MNVGFKRFILWAKGALHNSKKNRNNYACVFYFVDCYWLIFLIFPLHICTQTQIDVIGTQTRLGFVIIKVNPPVIFFILETLFVTNLY